MKLSRNMLATLAAVALLALFGCGKSTSPTRVTSLDSTPPPAPENLSLQSTSLDSQLNWNASGAADVASYQVFQYSPDPSREDAYMLLGQTNSTHFTLPAVATPTEGYFKVRAVDASGNTSSMSGTYDVTVPATGNSGTGGGNGFGHKTTY